MSVPNDSASRADAKVAGFFRTHFEIEAPDFWWALNRMELEVESPSDFILEMSVLPDDDALPQSILKWRTEVIWTQVVTLSSAVHDTLVKIHSGASFSEAMQKGLLDTPIPGYRNALTYSWIPKTFFSDMRKIHDDLDRSAYRVIDSLFWRVGAHCGPSTLRSEHDVLEYSLNGSDFDSLPIWFDLKASLYTEPPPKSIPDDFGRNLGDIEAAPVHHALFREAWKALGSEDRVAIVMASAAVESAIKHLVSKLQPDTAWLLENIPSPPVVKMLRELVEKLPAKCTFEGRTLRPPNAVIQKMQRLVECRNKLVHGSKCDLPDGAELEAWLIAVRDMLWLADFYCGHQWALTYVSPEVKEELEKGG